MVRLSSIVKLSLSFCAVYGMLTTYNKPMLIRALKKPAFLQPKMKANNEKTNKIRILNGGMIIAVISLVNSYIITPLYRLYVLCFRIIHNSQIKINV